MPKTSRIEFTEQARQRLDAALGTYREELTEALERAKFVPGEDVTEVTATDVELAVRRLRLGMTRRVEMRRFYSQVMFVVAVAMIAVGVAYPSLRHLLESPTQMILIGMGLYLGLVALFLYRVQRLRERREADDAPLDQQRLADIERQLRDLIRRSAP